MLGILRYWRTLRFFRAVRTHLTAARYVLLAALSVAAGDCRWRAVFESRNATDAAARAPLKQPHRRARATGPQPKNLFTIFPDQCRLCGCAKRPIRVT